jgi:hypothetical protein
MRSVWILCLLLESLAAGQANPGLPSGAAESSTTEAEHASVPGSQIAPDTPVLTITGLCPKVAARTHPGSAKPVCQTVVTRAQFEKLVGAVQPAMALEVKRQLASSYPKLLVMAQEAEKRGLDRGPAFEGKLRFARLEILSQELTREFQEEASRISEKDISDYYQSNFLDFELATVDRIAVPLQKRVDTSRQTTSEETARELQKEAEQAMGREAAGLRARAAAGEDFSQLQKEAYAAAGINGNPTSTSLGKIHRKNLPATHASVFALQSGEISPVLSDGTGYYIYKLEAKEVESLDAVREEIRGRLQNQRMWDLTQHAEQAFSTDVNGAYFGTASEGEPASSAP